VKEYDIFLPATHNDGAPVSESVIEHIKRALSDAFGGYTHFTHENEGVWKMGGVAFRDKVTVLRVLDDGSSQFDIRAFKRNLEQLLEQKSLLIVSRDVHQI